MIRIDGRGAVYGEVWYDEELPSDATVDIVHYHQRETPVVDGRATPFLSLITDLSVEQDAIMDQFSKDCRYKIRRADAKDGLHLEFSADPENSLDEFSAFFDAFARQKSLEPANQQWLAAACNSRQLALASASQHGEVLVWHAHVISGTTARLQYSASGFRNRDNDYRALVSRANRWLHWREMLRFRELGMLRYDWGGLFEDESVPGHAGVNNFKKDFGGRPERTYDCTVPVTLKGRIYLPLQDAWRRLHSARG
jgi:lipid II:glycine glycyltransferase (peptidoglycan interpeptide bridge formation enzyme)